jgi:CO/xanthine dehydrogenase FAD-binding subunit
MSVTVANSLDEALSALAANPDATVLAGGTDLMVEMNSGHRRAEHVVAVNRVPELRQWEHDPVAGTVRIGAGVTYRELEREPLSTLMPALAQAARTVGSPQIRHAATIGGNVGTCSPAGDGLPVLSALGATVELASGSGTRSVPFSEFMTGPKRTGRRPGELIVSVTVPQARGWQGYSKVGVRNAMVIATASAALVVDDHASTVAIALGSVGPTILRCPDAEAHAAASVDFAARSVSASDLQRFAELVSQASRPIDDHRSTARYRRTAVGVLAARLLRRAFPND